MVPGTGEKYMLWTLLCTLYSSFILVRDPVVHFIHVCIHDIHTSYIPVHMNVHVITLSLGHLYTTCNLILLYLYYRCTDGDAHMQPLHVGTSLNTIDGTY